jgi:hypothetical protein
LIVLGWTGLLSSRSAVEAISGPNADFLLSVAISCVLLLAVHVVGAIGNLAVVTAELRDVMSGRATGATSR